jgi:hypothetical protein
LRQALAKYLPSGENEQIHTSSSWTSIFATKWLKLLSPHLCYAFKE